MMAPGIAHNPRPEHRAMVRAIHALFVVPPGGAELRTLARWVRNVPPTDAGALRAALLAAGVRAERLRVLATYHPPRPRSGPPRRRPGGW